MFCTVEQLKPYLPLLRPDSGEAHLAAARLQQKLDTKAGQIRGRARLAGYGTLPVPALVAKELTLNSQPIAGEVLNCGNTFFTYVVGAPAPGQIQIGGSVAVTATNLASVLAANTGKTLCTATAAGPVVTATANERATDFLLSTDSAGTEIETVTALTQRDLLLRTLNLEEAAAEELAVVGAHWDPALQKLAESFRKQASWIRDLFDAGQFDMAFALELPTEPLATPDEVRGLVPGFQAVVSGTPTLHQASELCAGYSAVLYALAAIQGHSVVGLTGDQAATFREIVKLLVASVIERGYAGLKIEGFGQIAGALDPQANSLTVQAFESLKKLGANYFDEVFI